MKPGNMEETDVAFLIFRIAKMYREEMELFRENVENKKWKHIWIFAEYGLIHSANISFS